MWSPKSDGCYCPISPLHFQTGCYVMQWAGHGLIGRRGVEACMSLVQNSRVGGLLCCESTTNIQRGESINAHYMHLFFPASCFFLSVFPPLLNTLCCIFSTKCVDRFHTFISIQYKGYNEASFIKWWKEYSGPLPQCKQQHHSAEILCCKLKYCIQNVLQKYQNIVTRSKSTHRGRSCQRCSW